MIDHIFVWFDGSPGSGKTLLIERVLNANRRKDIGVVRFRQNQKRRAPRIVPSGSEETRRYLDAGACDAMLLEYSPNARRVSFVDEFWSTGFLGHLFDTVYCEAELTDELFPTALSVFVLPALKDPSSIFETEEIEINDEFMRAFFTRSFGHLAPAMKNFSKTFDDCINEGLEKIAQKQSTPPPIKLMSLNPGFEGLIDASIVVVNIRNPRERPAAERLIEYLQKVGNGPNPINRTFGYRWRDKKYMFVCNLNDPEDAELKKLITVIKRRFVKR